MWLPQVKKGMGTAIINLGSKAGREPVPGQARFAAHGWPRVQRLYVIFSPVEHRDLLHCTAPSLDTADGANSHTPPHRLGP